MRRLFSTVHPFQSSIFEQTTEVGKIKLTSILHTLHFFCFKPLSKLQLTHDTEIARSRLGEERTSESFIPHVIQLSQKKFLLGSSSKFFKLSLETLSFPRLHRSKSVFFKVSEESFSARRDQAFNTFFRLSSFRIQQASTLSRGKGAEN